MGVDTVQRGWFLCAPCIGSSWTPDWLLQAPLRADVSAEACMLVTCGLDCIVSGTGILVHSGGLPARGV
jgi:hypothetical protein